MTDSRRDLLLWTTDLGPPIVWLFSFQANFTLAPWACIFQVKVWLYFVSLLALVLELGIAALAWSQWKALGAELPGQGEGPVPRARIMALTGIVFGLGFAMVVLAQSIPAIVLGACE
ncbi:MAG: hypothetical protein ACJ74Y_17910 [Bryobacteraceae bacterium]